MKLIIIVLSSLLIPNELYPCIVTNVIDGDSFVCNDYIVRLAGVDAPEHYQEHSDVSFNALNNLISGQIVLIDIIRTGRYGRTIAYAYLGEIHVNEYLLYKGYAKCYRKDHHKYLDKYARIERFAQINKIGVWE